MKVPVSKADISSFHTQVFYVSQLNYSSAKIISAVRLLILQ